MLHLHRGHDADALADAFLDELAHPLDDPFTQRVVMVGNRPTGRWLQQRGAERRPQRVWANVALLTPQPFVRRLTDAVLGPLDRAVDPWDPGSLAWLVAEHLHDLLAEDDDGVLDPLRRATGAEDDPDATLVVGRRVHAVATDAARLFDRYALHRPAMLAAWRDGRDVDGEGRPLSAQQRWQPALLRHLDALAPVDGPAVRVARAEELLATVLPDLADDVSVRRLPARPCVVGVTTLPRLHLDLLVAVARHREVHLFVPTASPVAWEAGAAAAREGVPIELPPAPLLRSAGPLGAEAAVALHDAVRGAVDVEDHPVDGEPPSATTLLGSLQRSVVTGGDAGLDVPPAQAAADRSLVMLDAPGPLRQVEALRDELRRRFSDDPGLHPRDVLVLTPDLDAFGPLVAAALGSDLGGAPAIPVTVAGGRVSGSPVAAVLRRALALVTSRASASEVLDLLSSAPVRRAHGLGREDLATLDRWIREVGVRWGRDEDDRQWFGLPARRDHTWAAALDRLLVGVAMADEGSRDVGGVVPYDHVEDGADLDLLERVAALLAVVDRLAGLREPRGAGRWHAELIGLLDDLVGPPSGPAHLTRSERDAHVRQRRTVVQALDPLRATGEMMGRDVDVDAVARWVDAALDDTAGGGGGYGRGQVVVADLGAVRDLPHRVVCLLGMDDGSVPRSDPWAPHDLVAAAPRAGDRDRRAEDRHRTVAALVAARDALVVTWGGRDQRTGRDRAAALPVEELRDVVRGLVGEDGLAALTTRHPVLPTSPELFRAAAPVSFDGDRLPAAWAATSRQVPVRDPAGEPLPSDGEQDGAAAGGDTDVPLRALVVDAANPLKVLVRTLRLPRDEEVDVVPDVEPMDLDGLQRYQLATHLLASARRVGDVDAAVRTRLAAGGLPPGSLGEHAVMNVVEAVRVMVRARERLGTAEAVDVEAVLPSGGRVVGTVTVQHPEDVGPLLAEVRYVGVGVDRPDRMLGLWLRQQALAAATGRSLPAVLVARDGQQIVVRMLPAPDTGAAAAELQRWVDLVRDAREGRVTLPMRTASAWWRRRRTAEAAAADAGVLPVEVADVDDDGLVRAVAAVDPDVGDEVRQLLDRALADARSAWEPGFRSAGERTSPEATLLLRHASRVEDLLDRTDLRRRARVLEPLMAAIDAVDQVQQGRVEDVLIGAEVEDGEVAS